MPMIQAVANQSNTPKMRTTLSSFANLRPAKNAAKPRNANKKTTAVAVLKNTESVSLISSASADITDTTGNASIMIAVVRFVIFLPPRYSYSLGNYRTVVHDFTHADILSRISICCMHCKSIISLGTIRYNCKVHPWAGTLGLVKVRRFRP